MTEVEAGQKIRELVDAGYLTRRRWEHPALGETESDDEFVVWAPEGQDRSKVLAAIDRR